LNFKINFDRIFKRKLAWIYNCWEAKVVTELLKDKECTVGISFEFLGRVSSLSQNISKSGMVCRTSRKIEEMTLLDIRFELPETPQYMAPETLIECGGVVINCEKKGEDTATLPYEVAIFFNRISEKDRRLLSQYIAHPGKQE
jgi:hypothetical protein